METTLHERSQSDYRQAADRKRELCSWEKPYGRRNPTLMYLRRFSLPRAPYDSDRENRACGRYSEDSTQRICAISRSSTRKKGQITALSKSDSALRKMCGSMTTLGARMRVASSVSCRDLTLMSRLLGSFST